jgi:hypothetical protein
MHDSIRAVSLLRGMSGGSQAQLMRLSDGHTYVVKSRHNPQHCRTLLNEWLADAVLRRMRIAVAELRCVEIGPELESGIPPLKFGSHDVPFGAGPHLGSRCPRDPDTTTLWDFLPSLMLKKVANVGDFVGALVADKWLGNTDSRQAIFFRVGTGSALPSRTWVCQMIDHGMCFDGRNWKLEDRLLSGVYINPAVYDSVLGWNQLEPWFQAADEIDEADFCEVIASAPWEWIGEETELWQLVDRLIARRRRIPDLIDELRRDPKSPLRNWKNSAVSAA